MKIVQRLKSNWVGVIDTKYDIADIISISEPSTLVSENYTIQQIEIDTYYLNPEYPRKIFGLSSNTYYEVYYRYDLIKETKSLKCSDLVKRLQGVKSCG